jgi:hypothetical protein
MKTILAAILLAVSFCANACAADPVGFRAHKNSTMQTDFTLNNYTELTWNAESFDVGGRFSSNTWTPVQTGEPDRLVTCSAQVWVLMNATGNPPNYVAKLIKNGYPGEALAAGIGVPGSFANSFVIPLSVVDLAEAGDSYKLYLYVTNSSAVVDANPAHTWFSCAGL